MASQVLSLLGSPHICPPPLSLLTASLSPGYFLEDFVDMLCNQKFHQSWELLFHHSVVSPPAAPRGAALGGSGSEECPTYHEGGGKVGTDPRACGT